MMALLWYNKQELEVVYLSKINAKNYESKQKARFDTLFRDVLTAYAITNETSHQLKSTRVSLENLFDQITDLNRQYENSLIRYTKDYSIQLTELNKTHQDALHKLDTDYADTLKQFKQQVVEENIQANKKLTDIHLRFQRQTQQTNIHIYRALLEMKQRHQELDFEYDQEKQAYQKAIDDIEKVKEQTLKDIEKRFESAIKDNKAADQARLAKLSSELQTIQTKRQLEQTDFDDSILKIKTVFNRVTIKFNQKIRDIQKKFQKTMGQKESIIQKEIEDIQKQMDLLKTTYADLDRKTRDEFEVSLNKYDAKLDQLKQSYEDIKDQIIRNYSRDITVNNSKLANTKEQLNMQIKELDKVTQHRRTELSKEAINYKELLADLNKAYIKERSSLENQAKIAIKQTSIQNRIRQKHHQAELLAHDFEYIKTQEIYRLKRKIAERFKDQELKKHKYEFDREWVKLTEQNKMLEKRLFIDNQVLREQQGLEIFPYEAMVLLAREIHDAEMNYRTLENNHYKQLFSLDERKLNYISAIDENTLKHDKNRINITHDTDIKRTNVVAYLDMEYAKNSLSGYKHIFDERKKSFELQYQKREKEYLFEQDKAKETRIFEQKMISFSQKLLGQIMEVQESKALIEYDSRVELEKSRHTKEIGIRKAKRILDTSMNETQRQKRLFDMYFQMLLVMQNEFENILLLLRDIYQTSSITQWRGSIKFILKILEEQSALKTELIQELEAETTAYYQEKINELTAFKYMNLKESIISDYESEHKLYVEQIAMLDDQLKSLRTKSTDLFQQIAYLQNENANIESTKSMIYEQLSLLKGRLISKQQRKTARNLNNQISTLNKEITKNKDLIKHIQEQIRKTIKEMNSLDKNHKPLELMLVKIEKNREMREKNLDRSQYEEGRVYYDSIDAIKKLTTLIHETNSNLLNTSKETLKALDMDEILEKVFSKSYINLTKSAIRTRTQFLNQHKRGIELCDQQFIQIRSEQHRIMKEYETAFDLTQHNIAQTLDKRVHKMNDKLRDLENYRQSFTKVQEKQLQSQLKSIDTAMVHFNEQHNEKIEAGIKAYQQAVDSREGLLLATKTNTESVITELENKFKVMNTTIDSEQAMAYKDMSKKVFAVDQDIKQATQVFDEKIAFYGDKDTLARTRIQENLNHNRLKSHRAINQYTFELEILQIQVKRHAKRLDKLTIRRINTLNYKERLALIPLKFETRRIINGRKRTAKHTWSMKQSKLIK